MTIVPLEAARSEILARLAAAPGVVLLSDFDGTLTPIVEHPEDARLAPEARSALQHLARRPGWEVAILSGRSILDLQSRINIPDITYGGNHGLEIGGPRLTFVHAQALQLKPQISDLRNRLQDELCRYAGVEVEDKGLSLSVHYRRAEPNSRCHVRELVRMTVGANPNVIVTDGKMVCNVLPRVDWDKGHAARWIVAHVGRHAYQSVVIGDDDTDEDMFRAFPEAVRIRVGDGRASEAGFSVDTPDQVIEFLTWLLGTAL